MANNKGDKFSRLHDTIIEKPYTKAELQVAKQAMTNTVKNKLIKVLDSHPVPPPKNSSDWSTWSVLPQPNIIHQADIMHYPIDIQKIGKNKKKYGYILVVTDVGTRKINAVPIERNVGEDGGGLTGKKIVAGLNQIYQKMTIPHVLNMDNGSEFKNPDVKQWADENKISIRYISPSRHNQLVWAENANKALNGKLLPAMKTREIQSGRTENRWVQLLPLALQTLKKREIIPKKIPFKKDALKGKKRDNKLDDLYNAIVKGSKIPEVPEDEFSHGSNYGNNLLPIGTRVRVKLEEPQDNLGKRAVGRFRQGDSRWERYAYEIEGYTLNPDQPPLYKVAEHPHARYAKWELKPVDEKKERILELPKNSVDTGVIEKILDKQKVDGKIIYKIKYLGFPLKNVGLKDWYPQEMLISKELSPTLRKMKKKVDEEYEARQNEQLQAEEIVRQQKREENKRKAEEKKRLIEANKQQNEANKVAKQKKPLPPPKVKPVQPMIDESDVINATEALTVVLNRMNDTLDFSSDALNTKLDRAKDSKELVNKIRAVCYDMTNRKYTDAIKKLESSELQKIITRTHKQKGEWASSLIKKIKAKFIK